MPMELPAVAGGAAFLLSLVTIPLLARSAVGRRWVDSPGVDPLKVHAQPIPLVGGLGMILASMPSLALAVSADRGLAFPVCAILVPALGVTLLGLWDDRSALSPRVRLAGQFGAGTSLAVLGLALTAFDLRGIAPLGYFGRPAAVIFVACYVVGAINAFNMQDGLDGLAGGLALISCVGCGVAGAALGQRLAVSLACVLGGCIVGFLVYNFPPASVFMGDNGSYFLGFMIAAMGVLVTSATGTPRGLVAGILLVGLPVIDAALAIARRIARGSSPLRGDRSHIYDWLARRGLPTWAVDVTCYVLQAAFVAAGVGLFLV